MPSILPSPRGPAVQAAGSGGVGSAVRRPARELPAAVRTTLLAVCGVRTGAVVLDLTAGGALVRPAAAAAGRSGVVLVCGATALADAVPGLVRGPAVTHAFADLPGARQLAALRPLLRTGARVAVTAVDPDAITEAAVAAGYDVLHVELPVEGLVVAALRPRTGG